MSKEAEGFYGVMSVLGLAVGATLAIGALILVLAAVFPNLTARHASAFRHRPLVSFLVGAVVLALTMLTHHAPDPMRAVTGAVFLVLLLFGVNSVSESVGRKLYLMAGRDASRIAHLAAGWPVYAFACCVPVLGWFLVLPIGVATGIGSFFVSLFRQVDR